MTRPSFAKLITGVVACALLAVTVTAARPRQAPSLTPQHEAVVRQWLETRPWLRLATEGDCSNKEGLEATRQEYGRGYQPYYAAGDFSGDGEEDFAVVLVDRRKRSRRFAVAVFNGPFNPQRAAAHAFYAGGIELGDGGLVVLPGGRLIVGVFQSDNCVVLWPRGRGYFMEDCS